MSRRLMRKRAEPRELECLLTLSQSIPTGLGGTVLNGYSESADAFAMHDTGTNPSRITIVRPGLYEVHARVANPSGAGTVRILQIQRNAAPLIDTRNSTLTAGYALFMSFPLTCVQGDFFELVYAHDVGSSQTCTGAFEFRFVRPS